MKLAAIPFLDIVRAPECVPPRRALRLVHCVVGCLFIPVLLGASNDALLFTTPERSGVDAPPPAIADSVITVVAKLPYSVLKAAADERIPKSHALNGKGRVACVKIPFTRPGGVRWKKRCVAGVCKKIPEPYGPTVGAKKECADYRWKAHIAKHGTLSISRDGSHLRLAQGIRITGEAGLSGALASILNLDAKAFDVRLEPRVNVDATLDGKWCPQVTVAPVGRWVADAKVELVGRNCVHRQCAGPINLHISDILNGQFDKQKAKIQQAADSALSCEKTRPLVQELWHGYAIKVERENQSPLYLNITPASAAFSGLIPENDRLHVAVRIRAQTALSDRPVETKALPLPELGKLDSSHGGLQLSLQAVTSYDFLENELRPIVGRNFAEETPLGKIEVLVTDVDIYPSADALAIGLKVEAKLPGSLLSTSGWVYLLGKPTVAPGGRVMKVEGLRFSAVLDSLFWKSAAPLFQGQIVKALNDRSTFDLGPMIDKAASEIIRAVDTAHLPGLKFTAHAPSLSLARIYVTRSNLIAVAGMTMAVDVEVTEIGSR